MKTQRLFLGVLASLLLALSGCSAVTQEGESGLVALVPFVDEQFGIRGVRPIDGWAERALLLQQSAPVSMDEWVAALAAETDLIALPRSTGTYEGRFVAWNLYTFNTQLADAGPGVYRVDLGLAQGEGAIYMVGLASEPLSYPQYQALYETVLRHALYAFEPLRDVDERP